jgi:CBS domain-containing protein
MQREGIRHLVVVDGKRLLGILSDRDLGGREGAELRRGRLVRELMTTPVASAKRDTTLRQAANLMRGRLIGSVPVVENGRVVGIVTATDVLDELGRGSTRPAVAARRRDMRLAPSSARAVRRGRDRGARPRRSAGKGGDAPDPDAKPAAPTGGTAPPLGRQRVRVPDSARRSPLPGSIARPAKREAGRADAGETPAHIRAVGADFDDADRDYLRRKLGRKLGKFARAIERMSVRIEDVNGPRGGIDKRCRVKVVLAGLPSVMVEEQHHALQAAMDGAIARTEQAVRRAVQRRRTTTTASPRAAAA